MENEYGKIYQTEETEYGRGNVFGSETADLLIQVECRFREMSGNKYRTWRATQGAAQQPVSRLTRVPQLLAVPGEHQKRSQEPAGELTRQHASASAVMGECVPEINVSQL